MKRVHALQKSHLPSISFGISRLIIHVDDLPTENIINTFLAQRNLSWHPFATEKMELTQVPQIPMHMQEIFCVVTTFTNTHNLEPA